MDITVLNTSLQKIAVIDTVESIIWTDRYCGYGNFELYTQATAELLSVLQEDYYLQIEKSQKTMIIESIEIKIKPDDGGKLIVKGRSLESILDRRTIIHATQLSGDVYSLTYDLINRNFLNPESTNGSQLAQAEWRKISNMVWIINSDSRFTTTLSSGQYFGDQVYDVVKTICETNGVGFRVHLNSSGQFEVGVYIGTDRSYNQTTNPYVIFSPKYDNLVSSNYYRYKANFKNMGLVYSYLYDTGAIHLNWAVEDPDYAINFPGIKLRERYFDFTSVSRTVQGSNTLIDTTVYNTQIKGLGKQGLRMENSIVEEFDGVADASVGFVYGTDFFLGDIVQIENEYGLTGTSRITEVTFSESPSGIFIYPTFAKL